MPSRRLTEILCVLTTVAALAVMFFALRGLGPSFDGRLHAEIGRNLAQEALKLLPPGGQITVITRDTEAFRQPALEILMEAFRREVRRNGDSAVNVLTLVLDPLRPVEVPPGDFFEIIRRADQNRVIVSLLGPPALTPQQRRALGRVQPKIVAFCSSHLAEVLDLDQLFDAGLLHAAIVNRPPPSKSESAGTSSPSSFEQLYSVIRRSAEASFPSAHASR